jgi:4-amino-4-deoxy-L-arabinose transferase-like glycosyltransferase
VQVLSTPAKRPLVVAPLAILALAAFLRFWFLDGQSYWLDEAVTVDTLHRSFPGMLHRVFDNESTPPLYYVLAWLWVKLTGTGEFGLRSLSAISGTAFVGVAYLAGRKLVSERAGLIVAALAAVSPLLVYYSQEARAYGLLMLFGGLSLLGFAHAREEPTTRALAGWAVASALALASHYYALFLVAGEAIGLIALHRRRALPAVSGVALVGLALLPLALHQRNLDLANYLRDTSLGGRIARVPKQFLIGYEGPAEAVLAGAAGLLALGGVVFAVRAGPRARGGALVAGVLALAALLLPLPVDPDTFGVRNSLAAWLPAAIVVGAGFAVARPRWLGVVLTAALAAIGLFTTIVVNGNRKYGREDWRGAARSVGRPPPGGRIVVINPSEGALPLGLYLHGLRKLPPGGATVTEVVAVAVDPGGPGSEKPPPRPEPPFPPPKPMGLVRGDYAPGYSVAIFRSPRPIRLTARQLPPLAPFEPADRFLQRP